MYESVCTRNIHDRILQLVRFNLPVMNSKQRKIVLEAILNETGAMALIEFISPRGIIRTPKGNFYGILVFNSR